MSPGKDIDVYLRPLIDDLKDLWAKPGVETTDVATGLKFNMRAMVLWTINDFPAQSSLSRWSGQGYKACPTCNEDTPYVCVLCKTTYVGHKRFLKKPHKWRRSLEFNGETEDGDPPREFSRDAIMTQLDRFPTRVKDVMHIEKNVLESILNALLMNDKSKDTAKAIQDLKRLGIRSVLWLGQNKNEKCSKPQAAYSFTPEDKKKFCQFIKGVKLTDGFGSNFKHKVTDNDTNITGLKSHDYPIMMQRLLPYGLQQYLPPDVAKPLIELCLLFKQICSQTLMVDDMLKAQSKVIDILCNLELIYPPNFFDIMINLVIHLPLEAIFDGPIRPWWMYPFERYMKKLTNYDVTMKFNRPDCNVDCPPPTLIWYVLHNSPEIDSYRDKFKIEFPNKDMKEKFPGWFGKQIRQRHVDNDPGVKESSELFALACGPSQTPISVNSCVANGVRFIVHNRDERRITQNSGIFSLGPDREMYYGQLEQILKNNITQIKANGEAFKNDQYILATQVKQYFYLEDMARRPLGWKVVEHVSHKKFSNGGVIVVEDDPDVIHVDNSSDLALSTSLNDLEITALHIDGQSIDVDAPPDIIDVVDEDDDIIDEEDPIPHDLADSDDEDLVNLDIDDGVNVMSADVARGHGGDGGSDDRPPPYQIPTGTGYLLKDKIEARPDKTESRIGKSAKNQSRSPEAQAVPWQMPTIPIGILDQEKPLKCAEEDIVTFATGTLTNDALSWWNLYAQPIGIDQANQISWTELKELLTNKYCPRTEVKKMEDEFYNLVVKGNDLKTYIRRFQDLAILCPNMVPNAEKLVEVFINGLPRSIEGNVTASKPQTLEEAST
ncbi:hypothetical protein Tco_1123125 [Tanacetum coccineum]|uniref:Reverse transcriptase domain-containing protein n=1 Tax=Tanacetum coccineum TaxID=301880 RepID=A0ABQ5J455_9ASTR